MGFAVTGHPLRAVTKEHHITDMIAVWLGAVMIDILAEDALCSKEKRSQMESFKGHDEKLFVKKSRASSATGPYRIRINPWDLFSALHPRHEERREIPSRKFCRAITFFHLLRAIRPQRSSMFGD